MLSLIQFVAAGLAAVLLLVGGLLPVRPTIGQLTDDLARVGQWNSAGALAGAVVFACEAAKHFWPNL